MQRGNLNAVNLGVAVRRLQQKCKLSNMQATHVATVLEENGCGRSDLRGADKEMQNASGVKLVKLNGCVHVVDDGSKDGIFCQHVYGPQDERRLCPERDTSRYEANGTTPNEVVYYFPLRERLEALLKLPCFRQLLQVIHLLCSFLFLDCSCTVRVHLIVM